MGMLHKGRGGDVGGREWRRRYGKTGTPAMETQEDRDSDGGYVGRQKKICGMTNMEVLGRSKCRRCIVSRMEEVDMQEKQGQQDEVYGRSSRYLRRQQGTTTTL